MSETELLKEPKFRKSARERRKEKYDRTGAAVIGGAAIAGAAALYKTAKDKVDKAYGKPENDKGYKAAEKEGFTHTNKAKDFDEEGETKNEKK